jgi:dihydroorotate dehydrogenase electron transfer subunit
MRQETMIVRSNRKIAKDVYELGLEGEMVSEVSQPGQFVDIKVPRADLILRRPISISSIDPQLNQMTLVIRASGDGTASICETKIGETLDVLGPLGHGFETDFLSESQTALLIGGGIGIPPLLELAKQLKTKGVFSTIVLGFQNRDAVFYIEEFEANGQLWIATDDGSIQTQGTVETVLDQHLSELNYDAVYACGPKGLNRMVNQRFKDHPNAYVSLEERMACGIGACAACICQKADKPEENFKVCDDGPVFKTNAVIV